MNKPTYIGKVQNSAAQCVSAPIKAANNAGKTVKHSGGDLRSAKCK